MKKASELQFGGNHYKNKDVQPWDVVDTWPIEQQIGYYRGGALKYIMRMGDKDVESTEIQKGNHYGQKLLEVLALRDEQGVLPLHDGAKPPCEDCYKLMKERDYAKAQLAAVQMPMPESMRDLKNEEMRQEINRLNQVIHKLTIENKIQRNRYTPAVPLPQGMKVVRVEPTEDMTKAGMVALEQTPDGYMVNVAGIYKAMVDAA